MCGRYTFEQTEGLFDRFRIESDEPGLQVRHNVAPSQVMPAVIVQEKRRLEFMQWGLVPYWSKHPKKTIINARIEGIQTKPSFRKPIRERRCLIPATGFYEWKREPAGKVPYHIRRKDSRLFAFAGLYDVWKGPDGREIKTFAIVTAKPNDLLAQIHHRMPVILLPEQDELWLETQPGEIGQVLESLSPTPSDELEMYPVSRMVNSPKYDSPELTRRR